MKELEALKQEIIEIREEQEQRKELKFIGSQRKIIGHTLFEFNYKTGSIKPASFKTETLEIKSLSDDKSSRDSHRKVEVNEHCFYIQALNKRNAVRKMIKLGLLIPKTQ